jgi:hypothetical protein
MSTEFRRSLSRILILAGILWTFTVIATACGIDDVFNAVSGALVAIGPILALVGTLLAPGEAALITTAVGELSSVIGVLKTAVDTWLADTENASFLTKVEDALTVAQNTVSLFLSSLNVTNPVIQAWMKAVVAAANEVITDIANDILKQTKAEVANGAAMSEEFKAKMEAQSKDILTAFVGKVDAATAQSGLPENAKAKFHGAFHRHVGPHVGPIHI